MKAFKEGKLKTFILKYKISIIIGVALALYISFFPSDYTDDVEKINKDIKKATIDLNDKENKYQNDVNISIDSEIEKISNQIVEGKKERDLLKNEHENLKEKYDIQLAKEKEEERLAQEEKAKKEEELRVEEEKRKQGMWILESSGYNVWEAYLTPGTYQLSVKHSGGNYGGGNCIVYAGDRDNQKQILVVNEIGAGTFAGTFKVSSAGYYTLTFKTDGNFTFEYAPF